MFFWANSISIAVLLVGTGGQAPKGGVRDLPTIGLKITPPPRMTDLPLDTMTDWVRVGVKDEGDTYRQILVLSALPEGARRDARTAAGAWVRQSERQRDAYRVLAQRAVEWMSEGWEVLATYRVDDKVVTSLQWFGWRAGRPAMVYVLTYDVVDGRGDAMRLLVEQVARSCRTTPIRPASTQPVRLGKRQYLPEQGVSVQIPETLRMMVPNRKDMLLRAGAVDYLRDRLLPVLTLTSNEAKAGESPQVRLERTVDGLLPSLRPAGGEAEIRGPARLGDREAYQVVLGLTQRRERLVTAIRLTLWRGRALVLSLTYPAGNAEALKEAMNQIAGSFQFQP